MDDKVLLGAVGEKDAVLAFKAIGAKTAPAQTAQQVAAAVHRLKEEGVRVIFITETAAEQAPEVLQRYANDPALTLIPVPGTAGSTGYGTQQVRRNVLKAIGAELVLDQDKKEG